MGAITAVMLFVSVLIHELAHSLVAQHFGIPVPRITLFLFGGVSRSRPSRPARPRSSGLRWWPADKSCAGGPLLGDGAARCRIAAPLRSGRVPGLLNLILAVFNLIPGFPLDGGRVFRAIVWRLTRNYHRATIAAGFTGRFFGFLMIFFGVWMALTGDLVGGIWIAFIGWYPGERGGRPGAPGDSEEPARRPQSL